jgi:GNAT superfamily N-acetyltransferase
VAGLTPLLGKDEAVATRRLRLRALTAADLETLPWLAAALAPECRVADVAAALTPGGVAILDPDGALVGVAVVRPAMPRPDAASFVLIAVDPARRYAGLGGEAALAVETLVRERWRVSELLAPVPAGRGLAVYFWLRLGYRPLTQVEAPEPPTGLENEPLVGIWLSRQAAATG